MTCFSMRPKKQSDRSETPAAGGPPAAVSEEDLVLVLGAGRFGARAVRILAGQSNRTLWVVDQDEKRQRELADLPVHAHLEEGIDFLVSRAPRLPAEAMIVPAIPIHVAVEWLLRSPHDSITLNRFPVPDFLKSSLPHTWVGGEGSLLVSYADFLCPEDCPEPEDGCTVTGEIRTPLYQVMRDLDVPGFRVHVVQSQQLAPGLGGYPFQDLLDLRERVLGGGSGGWLIGTACRCHGTLTGLRVTRDEG